MVHIEIEGVFNLRDVGGMPTSDGGSIQPGRLYRSGSPDRMTEEGARRAHAELRVRTVIDLRHPDELQDAPSRGPLIAEHVERHHISPVPLSQTMADWIDKLNLTHGVGQSPERYFANLYNGRAEYAEAGRILARTDAYPVLIHCTAGKDRTGVLTALMLEIAGVPDERIALDYEESDASIAALIAYLREAGRNMEESDEELAERMRNPAERMHGFLDLMRAEYGDARGFFRAQGLSDDEIDALRSRLVEP